jgi:Replication initiator protein A C-terminal domain
MQQGWIKLYRAIMESSTFSRLNAKQKLIAIYLILNANHKDRYWYDMYSDTEVKVNRGQLVTSRNTIVNEWFGKDKEITEQVVRTTLTKLEKLKFLTKQTTNRYTLLTIENYDKYQSEVTTLNQLNNQVITTTKPSNNQYLTTNNNVKNDKNEKDINKDTILESEIDDSSTNLFNNTERYRNIEEEKLLKESLKDYIPPQMFNTLDVFSSDYEEMECWVGIIFRAKKKVEDNRQDFLQIEYLDKELNNVLLKSIRKIKKDPKIENKDNYLFASLYNEFERLSIQVNSNDDREKGEAILQIS